MRRTAILTLSLFVFALCGCTHTELTRRYKSKNFDLEPGEKHVLVSAFVMDTPAAPADNPISKLAPEGQRGFMEAVAAKAKSLDDVYQALTYTGKDSGSASTIEKNVFKKRVVFSVEKTKLPGNGEDDLTPADRINTLKVTLHFETNRNNPEFASWDKFDTKYGTVDLGTLHRSQHNTAGATLNVGPAAQAQVPVSGSANVTTDNAIDESINLQQRFIQITGAIKEDKKQAELFQESQVGYDLAGNFAVDFTITTRPGHSGIVILGKLGEDTTENDSQKKDTQKNGSKEKASKAGKIEITLGHLRYPVSSVPVKCILTSEYTIRHVRQPFKPIYDIYDREFAEGLHRVVFWKGESPKPGEPMELLSPRDLDVFVYDIVDSQEKVLHLGPREPYHENGETIDGNPLRFLHYGDAQRFLTWLKKQKDPIKVGDYDIYDEKGKIEKRKIEGLKIKQRKCIEIYNNPSI